MTPIEEKLLAMCREQHGLDGRDPIDAIEQPTWNCASRTNDWRNSVCADLRDQWSELSIETRLAIYLSAACDADFLSP